MRVAIDASRITVAARTGTENYALQLIRAMLALPTPHHFTLYFRDTPKHDLLPMYPNISQRVIPAARLWTHLRFAAALWQDRPDVTFVPAHTLPFAAPGRAVVTVHDLGYLFFPAAHPPFERRYLDLTTRFSAARATRIIADSQATKHDLIERYGVPSGKIDVVYPGIEGLQRVEGQAVAAVRSKYKLPERYLLFLGTLQPRKNIGRLIEAFTLYSTQANDSSLGLVLAGKRGWLIEPILQAALGQLTEAQRRRVVLPGYIADEDVAALYSGAVGFVFPSLYEGFGFPVLEAMYCGTPVLCSNTSSLPELAGEYAVLVDPLRVESIVEGLAHLLSAPVRLPSDSPHLAQFTWQHTAQQTLAVLERAAAGTH